MDYLAIALFVLLFATADRIVGGHLLPMFSQDQEVRLVLLASFLFGLVSAWRKDS